MDCPDCSQALIEPWDGFTNSCSGCERRALSAMVGLIAANQIKDETQEETP